MAYEKFYDLFTSRHSDNMSSEDGRQNRETGILNKLSLEALVIQDNMKSFFGFEADDDNPFGDIGDDAGGDDVFSDDGGSDDNPFGGIGDDSGDFSFDDLGDDSGDFFGGDSGEDQQKKKEEALKLDRAKAIKEDFDISRQIRADFPERFLAMQDIIANNISIVERTTPPSIEFSSVLSGMIDEYQKLKELISAYIEVMPKKPYDDIFATYVSFWSSMMRIKNLYLKITGTEEENEENMKKLAII